MRARHYLLALALLAGAAWAQAPDQVSPVMLPKDGLAISTPGFSFRTPGEGWQVENPGYGDPVAAFERGNEAIQFVWREGGHSVSASAGPVNWDGFLRRGKTAAEDLIAFVSWRTGGVRFGERLRNPHFSIVAVRGNTCVRWNADVDWSLPSMPVSRTHIETGLICSHPDFPAYAVEITIRQYDQDNEAANAANAAVETLFGSLTFKALPYDAKEITVGGRPWEFANAAGSLWNLYVKNGGGACSDDMVVARIDPATTNVLARIPFDMGSCSIAADGRGVWVLNHEKGHLLCIDHATNAVTQRIAVPRYAQELTTGGGFLWLKTYDPGRLLRIDPATSEMRMISGLGKQPGVIADAGNSVFVSDEQEETIFKVDAATGNVVQRFKGPKYPFNMKFISGYLWVIPLDGPAQLLRIDPAKPDEPPVAVTLPPYGPLILASWHGKLAVLGGHASIGLFDAETLAVELFPLPPEEANALIESGGSLWIAGATSLYRLDPK